MKWKLWTRNENIRPAVVASEEHDSRDKALEAACDRMKQRHVKVLHIEGPNGQRIEYPEIEKWCKARAARH
jgi:hypothetical protein